MADSQPEVVDSNPSEGTAWYLEQDTLKSIAMAKNLSKKMLLPVVLKEAK
jgi:hypothetical protein